MFKKVKLWNEGKQGDALVAMSADSPDVITIPGYLVGYSTGKIMKANEENTPAAAGIFDGYGYLRLLGKAKGRAGLHFFSIMRHTIGTELE